MNLVQSGIEQPYSRIPKATDVKQSTTQQQEITL